MPVTPCVACIVILMQTAKKKKEAAVSEVSRNITSQTSSVPEPITNSTAHSIDPTPIIAQSPNWLPLEITLFVSLGVGLFFLTKKLLDRLSSAHTK